MVRVAVVWVGEGEGPDSASGIVGAETEDVEALKVVCREEVIKDWLERLVPVSDVAVRHRRPHKLDDIGALSVLASRPPDGTFLLAQLGHDDTVMNNATSQIATRRNQRDSSKCRRLALGT